MASFESLQERLAALQETTGQLRDLIDRLANIKFQPGSVPLSTSDEDNVATELSTEISQILREEEEDLELLQEEIIDLRSGRPGSDAEHRKTRLKDGAHRLHTELHDCRTAFRKAQLSARRSLEAAQKLERDLLLASYAATASPSSSTILTDPDDTTTTTPNPNSTPLTADEARQQLFRRRHQTRSPKGGQSPNVVTTASEITLSLQRTHTLIAGELAKSSFASQTLAESSAALAELQKSYEGLDGLLTRSRDLVGTLLSAQKSDTWYLQMALRMLLATLAWLVFRRFLYGPLWWVLWLPLRTGFRVTKGVASSGGSLAAGVGRMEVVRPAGEGVGEEAGQVRDEL
jgi:protein transport protein SEC20